MSALRAWLWRFGGLFGRERRDRELAEEMESHLQMHIEDSLRAGMNPEEARRQALIKLGGIEQTKENYRERRSIVWIESLIRDVRFALRMLRKNPGLTAVIVITLALGIGVNTAVFSVVNGLLLRPLPVRAPEQITFLAAERKDTSLPSYLFSYADLLDFQKQANTFSDLFAYYLDIVGFSVDGKADQVITSDVTGNYFQTLGVKPALGRLLIPDDDRPGNELHMVLGYSFWQKRFGGNPNVVGKQVVVNGKPATIVGVAEKEFRGVYWFIDMDAYLPFSNSPALQQASTNWLTNRSTRILRVLGRLKSGVSLRQAQSSVDVVSGRLAVKYPETNKGISVRVYPERLARPQPYSNNQVPFTASLFLTLSVSVLLLACLNVANILLARATVRQREIAIRAALGSGTGRLARQMLTETMLLAFLGGIGGLLLGKWAADTIGSVRLDQSVPIRLDFSFDWRVFAYAFGMAVLAGIIVGLWPAFRASRTNLSSVLHEGGRNDSGGVAHHRMRNALVVAQIAGSLMLLIAAGLFVRSLRAAERTYLGFNPDHVLNVIVDPSEVGYDHATTNEFFRRLEDGVRVLPGVQSLGTAYSVPMGTYSGSRSVYIEGHPLITSQGSPLVMFNRIDESYLETMRIPLLHGRGFTASDNEAAPLVALVNQTMASRFWPGQDPIGKRFSTANATGPLLQVVGVIADGKYAFIAEDPQPYICIPLAQSYGPKRVLEVRSSVPPETLILQVQQIIHSLDPGMPISDLETMEQSINGGNGLLGFRLGVSLAATMGALGLVLAVIGVYGVVSYGASQRTREFGIRMSLGATARDVLKLGLWQGVGLILPGVLLGLILGWSLTHAMNHLLFGVSTTDPLTFGSAALLLIGVALLACYIPARRATRIDPMVTLRYE